MSDVRWLDLDGTANTRDVAGLPAADGRVVQPSRLLRSDNLQDLSAADVRHLVDDLGVRAVADLRTTTEVEAEGPGPLTTEPLVHIEHLSLVPEAGERTDAGATDDDAERPIANGATADGATADGTVAGRPVLLPWHRDQNGQRPPGQHGPPSMVYLNYVRHRPSAVVDALRLIAGTDGATIVHCAAGKDRTGTVVAFALAEVGVDRDAIVADYARSAERIVEIFDHLAQTPTYANDVRDSDPQKHAPRPETMADLLDAMDREFGGVGAWLRHNGWTEADAAALRQRLLD